MLLMPAGSPSPAALVSISPCHPRLGNLGGGSGRGLCAGPRDTTLTVERQRSPSVPDGMEINLHVAGLHYALQSFTSGFILWGRNPDEVLQRGIGRSHTSSCQSVRAKGRVYSIQSGFVLSHRYTVFMTHKHSAGAHACVGT